MNDRRLETRIRADGWHPDSLSHEALLELVPPLEFIELDRLDSAGLRLNFAYARYAIRYLRGRLGPETGVEQLVCLRLAAALVLSLDMRIRSPDLDDFQLWYFEWVRHSLEPSERLLTQLQLAGRPSQGMSVQECRECELALAAQCQAVLGDLIDMRGDRAVEALRTGIAMHAAGVGRQRDLDRRSRKDAEKSLSGDDASVATYQQFFTRADRGGPSLLRVTDGGLVPDPMQLKTRLDTLGCRVVPSDPTAPVDEQTIESHDRSALDAVEQADQVHAVRTALQRMLDDAPPGSARAAYVAHLISGEDLSLRAVARRAGLSPEAIRKAGEQVKREISGIQ